MKQANEKKQDLLLDALSCIDEDILEKSLSLRDGTRAAQGDQPSRESRRTAASAPYLCDLSAPPAKPPRKNPWRVLAVAAAACLLLCVIPLSMWMGGSMSKNESAGDTLHPFPGSNGEIQDGMNGGEHDPEGSPGAPMESIPADESPYDPIPEEPGDAPGENEDPKDEPDETAPSYDESEDHIESATEAPTEIPVTPYEPEEWIWNTVSAQNGSVEKNTTVDLTNGWPYTLQYSYTALVDTFKGSKDELEAFRAQPVSPEDELVLDLYAQYCMTLYTMDYGSHFQLFHPDLVNLRFTVQVAPHTYQTALGRINVLMNQMIPYDTVALELSLTENRLLAGAELTAYLESKQGDLAAAGLFADRISAVRVFEATGTVTVQEDFVAEDLGLERKLYCYEYNGVWYLDDDNMDDDLCIDLVLSDLIPERDYLKTQSYEGRIAAIEEWYILLEDGRIFTTLHTDYPLSNYDIEVGDYLTVWHYDCCVSVRMDPHEESSRDMFRLSHFKVQKDEA